MYFCEIQSKEQMFEFADKIIYVVYYIRKGNLELMVFA